MGEEPTKSKKGLWLGAATLLVVGLTAAGNYLVYHSHHKAKPKTSYFPSSITRGQLSIPVYYPTNLPSGYGVGNFKVLKHNVLYYTVTSPRGQQYNITIQPLVTSFDFEAFKKKFASPDEYNTPIGSNLVGFAGSTLLGSIQTTDNDWILLNSTATGSVNDMETITRALRQVNL